MLKKAVVSQFLKENHASDSLETWSGDDIVAFQEDLFERSKGRVSEKWFYTYFKNQPDRLPRIDMLNLLSHYAGYSNWNELKVAHSGSMSNKGSRKKYLWLLLPVVPLLIALYFLSDNELEYEFCMIDADKNLPVTNMTIDIKILKEDQSPVYLKTDSTGCFRYKTEDRTLRFVIQSPYHKTDTIVRNFDTQDNSIVKVNSDDYAMMLRYYSDGNLGAWKKRRDQLNTLIADDAQIYQVFNGQSGIELYSKTEFINKLTTPTSSLKNIQILQREYRDDQIVKLKFIIQ